MLFLRIYDQILLVKYYIKLDYRKYSQNNIHDHHDPHFSKVIRLYDWLSSDEVKLFRDRAYPA